MTDVNPRQKSDRRQRWLGVTVLVVIIISLPFLLHYFRNFYSSPLEEYKKWYPSFYLIVFPVVKILPFAVLGLLAWVFRKQLADLFSFSVRWVAVNRRNIILSLSVIVLLMVVAEIVLRKAGFKPGYRVYSMYFHPVDSLMLLEGFSADSSGMLTVSENARKFICEELTSKDCTYDLTPIDAGHAVNVYSIPGHFMLFHSYNHKSAFKTFITGLDQQVDSADIDFIESAKRYTRCPVNSDGFKSIEFKKYNSKRKSVLLIGDSFTWGHETSNLTNCFADLLLAKGYIVFNTGIEATDPTQYLLVARKYIPLLKPDFVVVNFYIGNDVMYFLREAKPFIPAFYSTNAGNLIACPEGVYFDSPEEAYQHTLAHFNIPKNESGFNNLCSKTVLSTLMWNGITRWKPHWTMAKYENYYQRVKEVKTKTRYSDIQVQEIERITEESGGKFILTVIPMYDGDNFIFPGDYPEMLTGIEYHVPPVNIDLYEKRKDGHYNDLGHAMHAEFIDSLIQTLIGRSAEIP